MTELAAPERNGGDKMKEVMLSIGAVAGVLALSHVL